MSRPLGARADATYWAVEPREVEPAARDPQCFAVAAVSLARDEHARGERAASTVECDIVPLARIVHEARSEGGKSAAVSGPSDWSRPEAYFQYVEDRRKEKVPKMQCYRRPQQSAEE